MQGDALIEIQSLVASFEAAHNDLDADQESLDAYRAEAKEIEEDIGALATDERILDKEERVIALASRVSEFKALTDQRLAALKAEMEQQRAEAAQAEQEWMQRVAAIRDAWSRVQEDVHTRLRDFAEAYSEEEREGHSGEKWLEQVAAAQEEVATLGQHSEEAQAVLEQLEAGHIEVETSFQQWMADTCAAVEKSEHKRRRSRTKLYRYGRRFTRTLQSWL